MFVERFLEWVETASTAQRIEAVEPLVTAYFSGLLDEETMEATEAALTLLLEDSSPDVRMALAVSLADSDQSPRYIISSLASDSPEIATCVLSRSPVFVDAELVDLAATGSPEQQISIACRNRLGPRVAAAIAEVSCLDACLGLLMNPDAVMSPYSLKRLSERFGHDGEIRDMLLEREDLPPEARVILVEKLGKALSRFAASKNWLSKIKSDEAVVEACDKAAITFIANSDDEAIERVISNLIERGKVTSGFLLRSICMGNITLFGRAIAQLADVPASRVEMILSSGRTAALKAVYVKAGLPERAFGVFDSAICAWRRYLTKAKDQNPNKLAVLVTREVLSKFTSSPDSAYDDLLVLLRKLSAEASMENARAKVAEVQEKRQMEELAALEASRLQQAMIEEFAEALEKEISGEADPFETELEATLEEELSNLVELHGDEVVALPVRKPARPSIIDAVTRESLEIEIAA